jgi:hypothetical protein
MAPVLVGLLLLVGGCESVGVWDTNDGGDEPPPKERVTYDTLGTGSIPADVLERGSYGDIETETKKVLQSEEAYASFWQRLHADRTPTPERPTVDFDQEIVVAIAIGQRPNGGYGVNIDSVRARSDTSPVRVSFTEGRPGEACNVSMAVTAPYILATVQTDREIVFEGSKRTYSCE